MESMKIIILCTNEVEVIGDIAYVLLVFNEI